MIWSGDYLSEYQIGKADKRGELSVTGISYLYNEITKNTVTPAVVKFMDDQLFIDASGSWVRKTAQLIASKPLLPPELCGGLPIAIEHSSQFTNDQHEDTYMALLDQND